LQKPTKEALRNGSEKESGKETSGEEGSGQEVCQEGQEEVAFAARLRGFTPRPVVGEPSSAPEFGTRYKPARRAGSHSAYPNSIL
jgi:hypothetical protein